MKKMLLILRWPCLLQDVLNRRFTVQNKPATIAWETITIISSFLGGAEENCQSAKFVAAQKMLLKQKTQQTFVNGLLGFITLGIYTRLEILCAHNNLHDLPIDMGNSICTAH